MTILEDRRAADSAAGLHKVFLHACRGGEMERSMPNKRSRGEVRNTRLQKVAADLFLQRGYDGVTIDKIVELAGGSKSTVYSEFGGKCGLFIKSIENLCREANKPLDQD